MGSIRKWKLHIYVVYTWVCKSESIYKYLIDSCVLRPDKWNVTPTCSISNSSSFGFIHDFVCVYIVYMYNSAVRSVVADTHTHMHTYKHHTCTLTHTHAGEEREGFREALTVLYLHPPPRFLSGTGIYHLSIHTHTHVEDGGGTGEAGWVGCGKNIYKTSD